MVLKVLIALSSLMITTHFRWWRDPVSSHTESVLVGWTRRHCDPRTPPSLCLMPCVNTARGGVDLRRRGRGTHTRKEMATRATLGGRENGKGADDLAEDNKRLQEMLHAALRREAEALRRVKHLSELLAEYRAVGSRTPSSGPDRKCRSSLRRLVSRVALKCQIVWRRIRLGGGRNGREATE